MSNIGRVNYVPVSKSDKLRNMSSNRQVLNRQTDGDHVKI